MTRKIGIIAAIVTTIGALLFILAGAVFCQATLHVPRRLGPNPPNSTQVAVVAADQVTLRAS